MNPTPWENLYMWLVSIYNINDELMAERLKEIILRRVNPPLQETAQAISDRHDQGHKLTGQVDPELLRDRWGVALITLLLSGGAAAYSLLLRDTGTDRWSIARELLEVTNCTQGCPCRSHMLREIPKDRVYEVSCVEAALSICQANEQHGGNLTQRSTWPRHERLLEVLSQRYSLEHKRSCEQVALILGDVPDGEAPAWLDIFEQLVLDGVEPDRAAEAAKAI